MERDEVRTKVAEYLEENELSATAFAHQVHSRMTAEDVTRFMSGQEPVDEARRNIKIESVMALFVYSLEPDGSE